MEFAARKCWRKYKTDDILLFWRIFWLFIPFKQCLPRVELYFLLSAITSNISLFVEFKSIASITHSFIDNNILVKLSPITQWKNKCIHVQWSSFGLSLKYFYFLRKMSAWLGVGVNCAVVTTKLLFFLVTNITIIKTGRQTESLERNPAKDDYKERGKDRHPKTEAR